MTKPERIQVVLGPDDQPTIVNPVHRGAAIDWKATAQLMGRQMLDDKAIRDEQFARARINGEVVFSQRRTLLEIQDHWASKLLPKWLKVRLDLDAHR